MANGPKLVIAISSTALFDMREGHEIYETQGVVAYANYQREHEARVERVGHPLEELHHLAFWY